MFRLDQYIITETIREDGTVGLYRGVRKHDGLPILIKALRAESPTPREIERLRQEFEIGRHLTSRYALTAYELERHEARRLLILEDFEGRPLARLLGSPFEVGLFLDLAVQLAAALADIHRHGVIHKDIKPAHILIHQHSAELKLTDFGIAAQVAHIPSASNTSLIEGSLAYMAPEQTGRMNRSIDHRSDLYSLGVTLYEILTGVLPFQASDPLEWVYCHIARQPPSPHTLVPSIPEALAALVLKLLAKQPEDRYQSASGLRSDLERCRAQWQVLGLIEPFPLGQADVSELFTIPQKLYGREQQVAALLGAFKQVVTTGRPRLMLISGYSGIGKSSLVQELYKPIVHARGYFIVGKFDQHKGDVPYGAIAQAFGELIQQILTENEDRLRHWKAAFTQALGANGQLIIDIIPQLELILGVQPPVVELPLGQAQNRLHMVFEKFIAVVANREHPLVLFVDDLQWLDPASLKLIAYLITHPHTHYLFLLGAYRDNEVDLAHPLMHTLAEIRESDALIEELVLQPLTLAHLQHLVADTVGCSVEAAAPLARLVFDKTSGNAFFAIQFLTTLYREGLLTYDQGKLHWSWDLQAIRGQGFTDNVVELMLGKLKRFSAATQQAITLAACLGHTAEAATLARISDWTEEQLDAALGEAVDEGLLLRLNGSYTFLHDRVQEAAYALIPEQQRAAQHLRIGRLLVAYTPAQQREGALFEIVNQLNRGVALITSNEEREQLAEFNLSVAKRAKAATAYASALNYLAAAAALLPCDAWERRYELTFGIELQRAECEFLTGALAQTEARLAELTRRAASLPDLATVTRLQVDLFMTLGRSDRAVAAGLDYLRRDGIVWPLHPTRDEVEQEYALMRQQLGDREIESLVDLPQLNDPVVGGTLDVLTSLVSPALFTDENLRCLVIGRMGNLSLEHGNSDASCYAYTTVGNVLGLYFGDYEAGFRFGELGLDLVEQRGIDRLKARVYLAFSNFAKPSTRHVRMGRSLPRQVFDTAQRFGDLAYASFSRNNLLTFVLASGEPLAEVRREAEYGLDFVRQARFGLVVELITAQFQLVRTLCGLTPIFGCFDHAGFSEEQFERHVQADPRLAIAACLYWIRKLQARVFADEPAAAMAAAVQAERLLWMSPVIFERADYHFYTALALAALAQGASDGERAGQLEALAAHQRQLQQWAEHCPENFQNRVDLIGAEIERLKGHELDAERLYERAICSARENGFVHNEALAYERASAFYRARGFDQIAQLYLGNARQCYRRWGAEGKVRQLEQRYPQLVESQQHTSATTFAASGEQLDLLSVIKAAQSISRAMLLPEVQETLMRLVLEHSGAQRGYLLLIEEGTLAIQAQAESAGEQIQVTLRPGLPVSAATLPLSLITYVRRTGEAVVLADATTENRFAADEYLAGQKLRSLLCLPIIRQSQLVGLLYLENNLLAGAFTSTTLTALEVLAAQAAIALDNARLYADVQHENAERQRAEQALRQAEERYRGIFEHALEGIYQATPAGTIILANPAMARMLGYESPAELMSAIGTTQPRLFADGEYAAAFRRRLDSEGSVEQFEAEVYRKDGSRIWLSTNARAVRDHAGQVGYYEGTSEDITARKRAEAEHQAHVWFLESMDRINRAIQGTDDLERLMSAVLEVVLTVFACDRAWLVYPCDPLAATWQVPMEHTRPHYPGSFGLGPVPMDAGTATLFQTVRAASGPVQFGAGTEHPLSAAAAARFNIQSMLAMALYPKGEQPYLFGLHQCASPRVWTTQEQRLFQEVGRRLTDALTSMLVYRALQASEGRLAAAQRIAHVGYWDRDLDGGQVTLSDEACQIFGLSPEERSVDLKQWQEQWLTLIHPEDRPRTGQAVAAALQNGPRYDVEYRVVRPSGEVRMVRSQGDVTWNELGRPQRMFGTMQDITELRQAEEELRKHREQLEELVAERTRELSTLLETSSTIASTLELQRLLRVVLDQLQVVVRYTAATIFALDGDELVVLDHNGPLSPAQLAQLRLTAADVPGFGTVRRTRAPLIVDDLRSDSSEARTFREAPLAERYTLVADARALLVVPLSVRERLIGMMRIESEQPGVYTPRTAQLALAFANQAAIAIENARLYDQARELATVEERARLARELHDAVTQTLFSASMIAAALPAALKQSPEKALRGVEELRRLTHGALAEMRTLLLELRPAALAEKPLGELLRSLCTAVTSRTRIPIQLEIAGDAQLAPEVQVTLYRITQEALNNIAKHAAASQVRLTGQCEPEWVELYIADDGRGFEPGAIAPGSLGLGIMHERAASIGATLHVESTPGAGTTVRVTWQGPLRDLTGL